MLRELTGGGQWNRRLGLLGWRYQLSLRGRAQRATWSRARWRALERRQLAAPVLVVDAPDRRVWWFEERFYSETEGLCGEDVLALVRDRQRKQRRRLERARAALANDGEQLARRAPIPRELRLTVFERDAGRCVQCGTAFELQYDHVIPVVLGGATTVENLQVLCAACNRAKGATLG